MIKYIIFSVYFVTLNFSFIHASVYYVAPHGKDTNPGKIDMPFATIQKAQQLVISGDTVYIRGGTYHMMEEQIASKERIWAYVTHLDKSGTPGKRINYWAYPNEKPVFDFKDIRPAGLRIIAFYVTGSWIHIKGLDITGVQVTIKTHTQSECFENKGSHNIYEQLVMHDGMAIGIYLLGGSDNLILNCDAYNNYDSFSENGRGGNTDGFGSHVSKGSTGNVFRGCRAWFNSDDGYDVINCAEPTIFENCWAFYNGYSTNFKSLGDGNGFKMGGYGNRKPDQLPVPIPRNIIKQCIAVRNKANGFYSNHHINGSNWYNNIAFRNPNNYNMLNRKEDNVTDVPGYNHDLRNNISYKGNREIMSIQTSTCTLINNFFDSSRVLTDADFVSVDETLLMAPRNPDGSLPGNGFLEPSSERLRKIHYAMATDHAENRSISKNINEIIKNKKLIFSEDFQKLDTNRWITEMVPAEGSAVYAKNKSLILDTRKGVTVWFNMLLSGNIAIEFDRTVLVDKGKNDRLSDMNLFWMATDPKKETPFGRNGVFESYDSLNLYYAGIGGNTNSTTRFRKY